MSTDAVALVACASSVVFVVITNLIMMMFWQDYHRLNESDQTVLFIGSVIFGVIALLLNLVCLASISNSLLRFLALTFVNIGLVIFFQLIVLAAIDNAKVNYLSDDQPEDHKHSKQAKVRSKTVNELLLMVNKRGEKQ